jgi:hypothetical protein
MSITDPSEQTFARQVIGEQQSVLSTVNKLNRNEIVGNLSQLPVNSAVNWPPGEDVRYVMVVKMRNPETGAIRETLIEQFSDVPVLTDDLRDMARQRALDGLGDDTITGGVGPDAVWGVDKVVIISASRRA